MKLVQKFGNFYYFWGSLCFVLQPELSDFLSGKRKRRDLEDSPVSDSTFVEDAIKGKHSITWIWLDACKSYNMFIYLTFYHFLFSFSQNLILLWYLRYLLVFFWDRQHFFKHIRHLALHLVLCMYKLDINLTWQCYRTKADSSQWLPHTAPIQLQWHKNSHLQLTKVFESRRCSVRQNLLVTRTCDRCWESWDWE